MTHICRNQLIRLSAVLFLLTTSEALAGPAVGFRFLHSSCVPGPEILCLPLEPFYQLGKQAEVILVAQDADGHIATNYTGSVEFSSSDLSAALPPIYTFRMSDNGFIRVTTTFYTSGAPSRIHTKNVQTLTATDQTNGISGSAGFDIYGPPWQVLVKRFYMEALGREPSAQELTGWVQKLDYRRLSVVKVAQGIMLSQEFENRRLNHSDYTDALYRTLLDREADSTGRTSWLLQLNAGTDRSTILKWFLSSPEFGDLAKGFVFPDWLSPIEMYVAHFHQQILPSPRFNLHGTVFEWPIELTSFSRTGADLVYALFLSRGFLDRELSDRKFILVLYQALFGRDADEAGLNYWLTQLSTGKSRPEVLKSFILSEEFGGIANRYKFRAN